MTESQPLPALVATLGLAPQVITRALDELLKEEKQLSRVYIIHTSAYRRHDQWPSFPHFVAYLKKTYPQLTFHLVPIVGEDGHTVYDVETPELAELTFKLIFNEVRQLKRKGHRLHGLIAGGRKSMIVYTMISAQLLFDEDDQLWHLFSTKETWDPHVSDKKDKSHLVEIPILHLAGLMPMVRELILNSDDPNRATRLYRKHEKVEEIARLQRFHLEECDETDRKILALILEGEGNFDIGLKVGLGEAAVINRVKKMARRFYNGYYGPQLTNLPTRYRIRLLEDLRPLLSQIKDDES